MVVYNATEKDCVGEDGETQECVICFEDFEVGAEMGRLECLCKYHKVSFFTLVDGILTCVRRALGHGGIPKALGFVQCIRTVLRDLFMGKAVFSMFYETHYGGVFVNRMGLQQNLSGCIRRIVRGMGITDSGHLITDLDTTNRRSFAPFQRNILLIRTQQSGVRSS